MTRDRALVETMVDGFLIERTRLVVVESANRVILRPSDS
jgi:hypothetical protein